MRWAAGLIVLTACGPPGSVDAGSPAPPEVTAPASQSPQTASAQGPDGAPNAENEAYRSRAPVAPGTGAVDTDGAIRTATQALEALAGRVAQPTSRQVVEALVAAGFDSAAVQAYTGGGYYDQPASAHAVGIDLGGVCVTGGLRDGVAELSVAGGYIADGGCLAM
jgi:hypothetical protein